MPLLPSALREDRREHGGLLMNHTPRAGDNRRDKRGARSCKVLVVDDEPDVADLAVALLRSYGLRASVAYSAAEAMRALEADRGINAVFSDVMMPDMTGLQLARLVRERYPGVVVVLTSGYTPPELLVDRDRFYFYTAKPYAIDMVIKLLCSELPPNG